MIRLILKNGGEGDPGVSMLGDDAFERAGILYLARGERLVAVAARESDGLLHVKTSELGAGTTWRKWWQQSVSDAELPSWAPKKALTAGQPRAAQPVGASTITAPRPPSRHAALQNRLIIGAVVAFIAACVLQAGRPDLAIAALLTPVGIVAVGVLLLAAAAWPRWWPMVGQTLRRPAG